MYKRCFEAINIAVRGSMTRRRSGWVSLSLSPGYTALALALLVTGFR
jgi:hypothetical protein